MNPEALRLLHTPFPYAPTAAVLHWLSAGHLGSRLQRSLRLWCWLKHLYGEDPALADLPQRFRYRDLSDRLLAPSHPRQDGASTEAIVRCCRGSQCLCQQSVNTLVFRAYPELSPETWVAEVAQLAGIPPETVELQLESCPFATVHRSLRDDLKLLVALGWLVAPGRGQFMKRPLAEVPQSSSPAGTVAPEALSSRDQLQLLRILEPIAFL